MDLIERNDMNEILKLYHNSLLGGHTGADRMYKTISRFYKWQHMLQDIKTYVNECTICKKTKFTTHTRVPMEVSSLGETLFDHVYIDFVGPIPDSADGHKYIFTAICDLTKFSIAVPTFDSTALTAAECLIEHVLCRYNFPSKIISDNASSFTSKIIKELCNLFLIGKNFATPYHPQANIVERAHRTLNAFLRAYTNKTHSDWNHLLKYATFAYNNTIHSTTKFTPHELAHGFRIKIPSHLSKSKIIYNYDNFADITKNNIAQALQLAKEHLETRQNNNKTQYDKKINNINIQPNDLILVKDLSKSHKFDNIYEGPFRVIDAKNSYVEYIEGRKKHKIHKNYIKKYTPKN